MRNTSRELPKFIRSNMIVATDKGMGFFLVTSMIYQIVFASLFVSIAAAEEIVVDPWVIPIDNIPYPTRIAAVGDVISFHYSGNHNVYVSNQDKFSCDTEDAVMVGGTGDGSANFTFTSASALITFFCDYTTHCEIGQHFGFEVYPSRDQFPQTGSPSNIPTPSPSRYPSVAPSLFPTVQVTAAPFVPLFDVTFAPSSDGSRISSRTTYSAGLMMISGAAFFFV